MGNHPTFIMLDREKYPYTPAYHIFHTGFPCMFRRIDALNEQTIENIPYTVPLTLGKHGKDDYIKEEACGYLTIAKMVEMVYNGANFKICQPDKYIQDIRMLLHFHLEDWSNPNSFIGINPDTEGLLAMKAFYKITEHIARDVFGGVQRIARSDFAAALDSLRDHGGLFSIGTGGTKSYAEVFGEIKPQVEGEQETSTQPAGKNVFLDALLDR